MKLTKLVTIAFILGTASASALLAQTRPGSTPAEFPPASYMGKQYVDSTGCVFIRAGIDGTVSWVPRITRARQGVCGFRPTFAGQVAQAEPAQTAPAAGVTQITLAAPAQAVPATAPAPQPRPVTVAAPRPQPQPQPRPQVVRQVAAPAPMIVEKPVQSQRQPQTLPPRQPRQPALRTAPSVASGCVGGSPISTLYLRGKGVRCGPQTMPIVAPRNPAFPEPRGDVERGGFAFAAAPIEVSPHTRIVPRHVAINRLNTTNVQVPKGYNPVWEDGRLNPHRAEQSLAGHQAMTLIWTSTVPRRLINRADGRDVTASVPLVYPFTDYAVQQQQLGEVSIVQRDGQTLKRIVHNPGRTSRQAPVYSSRSTPPMAPKATRAQPKGEVAADGFVQVGAFRDPEAAQRLAREVQRMGLPVREGRYTRSGTTLRLVIAGPFDGQREVSRVVSRLRGAGYSAFAR